ncbi:hypothetical protein LCGC14_0564930 [marine sediment metagenome]|uniref:Uncharacterized protein n=1 Tax=marine sediment metagenome TaxID=412755 RepID=A0A0F9RKQ5_9ZZZZ
MPEPTGNDSSAADNITYKVDGVEKSVTLAEAQTKLQKGEASEERFRVASETLKQAEALNEKNQPLADIQAKMDLIKARPNDDPEAQAAFREVARFFGATEDAVTDMLAAQNTDSAPAPAVPGAANPAAPAQPALPAAQTRTLTRVQQFLAQCDAKGIDPVSTLENAQAAHDSSTDARGKEIVNQAIDKHKILGTICKNKTHAVTIRGDVWQEVFRRVEGGAAFSQTTIDEALGKTLSLIDVGAKVTTSQGPTSIAPTSGQVHGLERFHRLAEKPVYDKSKMTMAEHIDNLSEYARNQAETEAALAG